MTKRNHVLLFGWLGLQLCSMFLAAFVSIWFIIVPLILLLTIRVLPREVLHVLSGGDFRANEKGGVSWKDVFNANHGSWAYVGMALEASVKAGYPMISWNGIVYEIKANKRIYLNEPFCLAEELK